LLIETAATGGDSGSVEVGGDRASVDTELGGELIHRVAGLVAGDQCLD
jgi:hypothetical protein